MIKLGLVAFAAAALPFAAAPALAHHAVNAQFDVSHLVPLTGVLTRLDNLNPHAYWHFDVKGPDGVVQKWNCESLAPAGLRRAGVRIKDDIKIGQTYNVQVAPSRNGSQTGLLIVINIDGKDIRFSPI